MVNNCNCIEISPDLPNIKTSKDILNALYDRDRLHKKYYKISIVIVIVISIIIVILLFIFDKKTHNDITSLIKLENISIGVLLSMILFLSLPWVHSFILHRTVTNKWKTKNKLK